jgi:hypothetical protein
LLVPSPEKPVFPRGVVLVPTSLLYGPVVHRALTVSGGDPCTESAAKTGACPFPKCMLHCFGLSIVQVARIWLVHLIFFWGLTWHPPNLAERLSRCTTQMRVLSSDPRTRQKDATRVLLGIVVHAVVARRHFELKKTRAFNTMYTHPMIICATSRCPVWALGG